jgi:chromosome segregation ATPase
VDTQALQLHEKVQKLIEQYTIDKKRLAELEDALSEKTKDSAGYSDQIKKLQSDIQTANQLNTKLTNEITELKKRNEVLEKSMNSFEDFAGDLNSRIDDLIPKIEKI